MHFTQFIMHNYIHAYSRLCCMPQRRRERATLHILIRTSQQKQTPPVNGNILNDVHQDITGYHLKECQGRVHEI